MVAIRYRVKKSINFYKRTIKHVSVLVGMNANSFKCADLILKVLLNDLLSYTAMLIGTIPEANCM